MPERLLESFNGKFRVALNEQWFVDLAEARLASRRGASITTVRPHSSLGLSPEQFRRDFQAGRSASVAKPGNDPLSPSQHGVSIIRDFLTFKVDLKGEGHRVQEFKFTHFGHDIVVLHERDIRKQKPPFVFLNNREKRDAFMNGLNRLIDEADFTIVPPLSTSNGTPERTFIRTIHTNWLSSSAWSEPIPSFERGGSGNLNKGDK